MILIFQMFPHTSAKESILWNIKNIHISYKHKEKSFLVNLSNNRTQNFEDTGQEAIGTMSNSQKQYNFKVDRETMIQNVLKGVINKSPQLEIAPQKVVIDFSSPNIAKPFHAGHLRSTIIGNFIANINKHFSNNVTKINYLGDWGTQFGMLQYGLRAKNIDISNLNNAPIKTLYEAYVYANKLAANDENIQQEARKYFADIEQGKTQLDSWKKIRQLTIEEIENIYQRLGIQFDAYLWESDYNGGVIKSLMDSLEMSNIIRRDESGKKVAEANGRTVTILKSDDTTLYLSRDIASLLDKFEKYKFDKMLYVVDNAQTDHFAALFDIMRRINKEIANGCEHVKFGRIKGMSTRTGNVVFLNDILDEAKRKMHEKQLQSRS